HPRRQHAARRNSTDVQGLNDARMREARDGSGFLLKLVEDLLAMLFAQLVGKLQHLDRDALLQRNVQSLVDHAEAAARDGTIDAKAAGADHLTAQAQRVAVDRFEFSQLVDALDRHCNEATKTRTSVAMGAL